MQQPTTSLLQDLAAKFCRFDRLLDIQPLGDGNINGTYLVTFEKDGANDAFVLQEINQEVFKTPLSVMDNLNKINHHLGSKASYPYSVVPHIPTLEKMDFYADPKHGFWRGFPYIKNSYAPENCTDPQVAYEAAKAYGAFTSALLDFPAATLSETIIGFHDSDQRWVYFKQIHLADPVNRVQAVETVIKQMYETMPVFQKITALKQSGTLPLRVTHNDTKAGNVLFSTITHQALAVIDLDTVMPGTILSDFGDMVRTFCPSGKEDDEAAVHFRGDIFEALSDGFLSQTKDFLSPSERENLYLGGLWIIAEQALRFLTDYIAGDVYYKTQYDEHNLVRAKNQLSLYFACLDFLENNNTSVSAI